MFKVFYKYSACIKICTEDISILCDPWFGKFAYDGTWTQYPSPQNVVNLIGSFEYPSIHKVSIISDISFVIFLESIRS